MMIFWGIRCQDLVSWEKVHSHLMKWQAKGDARIDHSIQSIGQLRPCVKQETHPISLSWTYSRQSRSVPRVVTRVLSPAGRLTTKSIVHWPELWLVTSVSEDRTSPSQIWMEVNEIWKWGDKRPDETRCESRTEVHGGARWSWGDKRPDETRCESRTEVHGGARWSWGGKVILILRIRTTQGWYLYSIWYW